VSNPLYENGLRARKDPPSEYDARESLDLRKSIIGSVLLHVGVISVGYFGLPHLRSEPMVDTPIVVELMTVADVTNAPPPRRKPKAKPEPKKRPPPPPPPKAAAAPPPPPPPAPKPDEEVAAVPSPPQPKPKPKEKPKPKVKPKPKAPKSMAKVKPRRKPKPPDPFASVLRTVEKLEPSLVRDKDDKKKKKKPPKKIEVSFETAISKALKSPVQEFDPTEPLSISEIDLVRRQIRNCWLIPAGAKDARDLVIDIHVQMNLDGTVRVAQIRDTARLQSDTFYRTAAEQALRAVLNPRCQPFKLPRDKYQRWKTMTLSFNPKDML